MSLNVRSPKATVWGNNRVVFADVTFDNSYATGGESLTSRALGFSDALTVKLLLAVPASGLIFEYDHTNQRLKAHYPTGGATSPTTPAAPRAATTVPAGATTVTAASATPTYATALTAGTSAEVASTADLSTVTTRVMAILA